MVIKNLTIKNFQCHRSLDIELGPVVSFVGPSNIGKSAILRALRWLVFNQAPAGFRTHGTHKTFVTATLDDGTQVSRVRTKTVNEYRIGKRRYKAVGRNVPDEVAALFRMSDLNFQTQFSAFYWIGLSPAELHRRLNELVDLDLIDRLLKDVAREERETKTALRLIADDVAEVDADLERLSDVPALRQRFKLIESTQDALDSTNRVLDLCRAALDLRVETRNLEETLARLKDGAFLLRQTGTKLSDTSKRIERLRDVQKRWLRAHRKINSLARQLTTKKRKLKQLEKQRCPLCGRQDAK